MGQDVIYSGDDLYKIKRGLYLINRLSPSGIDHTLVFDSGNVLGFGQGNTSMIYHLPNDHTLDTPSLDEYLQDLRKNGYSNLWFSFEHECVDIQAARSRLIDISEKKEKYNWVFNNCEHFAYLVTTGEKQSPRLSGLIDKGLVMGVAAITAASALLARRSRRA